MLNDCQNRGFVLDGYPKTYDQAKGIFLSNHFFKFFYLQKQQNKLFDSSFCYLCGLIIFFLIFFFSNLIDKFFVFFNGFIIYKFFCNFRFFNFFFSIFKNSFQKCHYQRKKVKTNPTKTDLSF